MSWLDALYLTLTRRIRVFSDGWGDPESVLEAARSLLQPSEPEPLIPTWHALSDGVSLGKAQSPCALLPKVAQTSRVLRLSPKHIKARVVIPPSWGEETFTQRRWGFSALLKDGIELWLLEGAFFGTRREAGRLSLSTVEEMCLLGYANVLELRGLLATARADGTPAALAGYSMAGQLAAQAAATLPWDVPVAAMAAPDSAAAVFLEGPLSRAVHFGALGQDAADRLRALFTRTRVQVLPPPRSALRRVVATRGDRIVPPAAMERIASHWGVTPTWVDSGHLGGFVLHRRALQHAVRSLFPFLGPAVS